jgi:hypothetical protein
MPDTIDILGVAGPTGVNLRTRVYTAAGGAVVDVALAETSTGQYAGSATATLAEGYHQAETRRVASQTGGAFDASAFPAVATRGDLGRRPYFKGGQWYASAAEAALAAVAPARAPAVNEAGAVTTANPAEVVNVYIGEAP